MASRFPCRACGHPILPTTATGNGGLCMPYKGGYQQNIKDNKRFHAGRRYYLASSQTLYQSTLVNRVHDGREGFARLSPVERSYYTLSVLSDEVYNGGFDQYFGNSSDDQYQAARAGLRELEVEDALTLLEQAAALLFGDGPVPVSQAERQLRTPTQADEPDRDRRVALNALGTRFYALADALDERLLTHAHHHILFTLDEPDEA